MIDTDVTGRTVVVAATASEWQDAPPAQAFDTRATRWRLWKSINSRAPKTTSEEIATMIVPPVDPAAPGAQWTWRATMPGQNIYGPESGCSVANDAPSAMAGADSWLLERLGPRG